MAKEALYHIVNFSFMLVIFEFADFNFDAHKYTAKGTRPSFETAPS